LKKTKRRIPALFLALALMLSVAASAATPSVASPMYNVTTKCTPTLTITGTRATCRLSVSAQSGATISGTLTLYESGMEVMSWPVSGTAKVSVEKRWAVLPGHNYTLTVNVTVSGPSGTDHIVLSTSRDCP